MDKRVLISVRVPLELLEALDRARTEQRFRATRTELIVQAIRNLVEDLDAEKQAADEGRAYVQSRERQDGI